jgi:exodeoxyribonuclease V beta subunit
MTLHKHTPEPFDVLQAPLDGSNLIEASAGTGKTYSIAILVLRMILSGIPVEKILMVTFTKAAVAELKERVDRFIRQAQQAAQGAAITDATIAMLVQQAIESQGREVINNQLSDAVLMLDELAVMTIHGFCQQTLTEFAFETRQPFGMEMFTELDKVIEQEVNNFWRKYVTTMDTELLALLQFETLRQDIREIVRQHLDGKLYGGYDAACRYSINDISIEAYNNLRTQIGAQCATLEQELIHTIEAHKQETIAACKGSRSKFSKDLLATLDEPSAFISQLIRAEGSKLFKDLPIAVREQHTAVSAFMKDAGSLLETEFRKQLFFFAIQEVSEGVSHFLAQNNLMGYNDLIRNLYLAVTQASNDRLLSLLQQKYQAVFVDEFQDTDKEQFEIFRKSFLGSTTLFLIGDPKQSIYAWRKADIYTYFSARAAVSRYYTMNTNYRSSTAVIHAMNRFFRPLPDFDTFYFSGEAERIDYINVESPQNNQRGTLRYKGSDDMPLAIFSEKNKENIRTFLALQVQSLLTDPGYTIASAKGERNIVPGDIGILVRSNQEGIDIKNLLTARGIPAVSLNEARIMGSAEAQELVYLLEAIWEPERGNINKALLAGFCGFNTHEIQSFSEEHLLQQFRQYREIWVRDGIYPALMRFIGAFDIKKRLGQTGHSGGVRILANLLQLVELLNQEYHRRELAPEELIAWFQRGVSGMVVQGDEYQQRIESDEEAVKIITIHKSKGLEYNIVLAPFLDMALRDSQKILYFRDPGSAAYICKERVRMTPQELYWYQIQQEQENRRLIYVALTRAVYKCIVFKNTYYKSSGLSDFVQALGTHADNPEKGIYTGPAPLLSPPAYRPAESNKTETILLAGNFRLVGENWRRLSYTGLSAHGTILPKDRIRDFSEPYDEFIYNKLKPGAATGNLLHELLEEINFTQTAAWKTIIQRVLSSYLPFAGNTYAEHLHQLLEHVLYAAIRLNDTEFRLNEVPNERKLSELEFDFPLQGLNPFVLNTLSDQESPIQVRSFEHAALEGMMNGKIDLLFECKGKYYILDWKSNYLGYRPEDYNREALQEAMTQNNYHLQYLLYTVAVRKYLSARLPDFHYERHFGGVIYMFLRGIRKEGHSGIFTARPSLQKIRQLETILQQGAPSASLQAT